jgi:uncharacterized protein YkwD
MGRIPSLVGVVFPYGLGFVLLGGCGLITGADGLVIDESLTAAGGSGSGGKAGTTGNAGAGSPTGTAGDGGAGAAGGNGNGGAGATGAGAGPATGGTGGGASCAPCGPNEYCEAATATCVCSPGFLLQDGSCKPAPPGDPSTRTQEEVCQKWKDGHVVTTPDPLTASGQECDAGTLKQGAINDTLTRINMFRWLAGLGPTTDDATLNAGAQLCANLESWWDFGSGQSPHSPPASSKCYTADGGSFAGQSNIAWGSGGPAQAIDQFMQDNGNETTIGHRRWIVNPPLNPVGIGYWQTGGQYGNSECLRVFGTSGSGPDPDWVAVPNQGYVPAEMAQWTWTFHGNMGGVPNAQISMLSVDDNTPVTVSIKTLSQGYGEEAISWVVQGGVTAGKTYRVTVSGVTGGDVVYDVKPIACN